jgi:hypothetical protein
MLAASWHAINDASNLGRQVRVRVNTLFVGVKVNAA